MLKDRAELLNDNVTDSTMQEHILGDIGKGLSPYLNFLDPMQHIESVMEGIQGSVLYETTLHIAWDLWDFRDYQMNGSQDFGSMLTVTGSVDTAWATTCKQYAERYWPDTAGTVLKALESIHAFDGDFGLSVTKFIKGARVKVRGTKRQTIQAAQQLTWMASAFRTQPSPPDSPMGLSRVVFQAAGSNRFSINCLPFQPAPDTNGSCWLPLFKGCVIAQGFPTPERGSEIGVEMSLDAMACLSCVEYPVHNDGVIVLKGWSAVLYPVRASSDFGMIQWHLVSCDDPDDEQLVKSLTSVTYVRNWKDASLDTIRHSRSFLGYCSSARTHLGAKDYEPQSSDRKSGAGLERSRIFWQKKVGVSMGTGGMGAFGFTAAGELGFSKMLFANMSARENFGRVLDLSKKTPVLIYDVSKLTAWLVPELMVVLHITRSWFLEREDLAEREIDKLPSVNVSEDGGQAAYDAITSNTSLEFKRTTADAQAWKFMEIVKDSLRILKACRDTSDRSQSSNSASWLLSWFQAPRLYGWDMADMIDARDYTYRKEISMHKNSDDKWISCIANHPDVLVLLCRDIQPPIRPAESEQICRNWNPVPSGENYLVSTLRCLKDLARHCNGGDDGRKLTEKCYWSRPPGSNPFVECNYKSRSGCDRLQTLVDKGAIRPKTLPNAGAVVFGSGAQIIEKCQKPKARHSERAKEKTSTKVVNNSIAGTAMDEKSSINRPSSSTTSGSTTMASDHESTHKSPTSSRRSSTSAGSSHNLQTNTETTTQPTSTTNPHNSLAIRSSSAAIAHSQCLSLVLALSQRNEHAETEIEVSKINDLIKEGEDIYEVYLQQKEELRGQDNLITEMHARLDGWIRARVTRSKSVGGDTEVGKREGGGAEVEAENGSTTAMEETDGDGYGYEEGLEVEDLYD
jgi:hypothetical protein